MNKLAKALSTETLLALTDDSEASLQIGEIPSYVRKSLHEILDSFLDTYAHAIEITAIQRIAANLERSVEDIRNMASPSKSETPMKGRGKPKPRRVASNGRRLHGLYIGLLRGLSEAHRKLAKAVRAKEGVEKAISWMQNIKK